MKVKRLIGLIIFSLTYLLELIIHILVATLSARGRDTNKNLYQPMLVLNIFVFVLTTIGWCILIQNTTATLPNGLEKVFSSVSTNLFEDEIEEEELSG